MRYVGISRAMSDLLLLSGGIDSTAIAAWFRPSLCLTIDYGQQASLTEIETSAQICSELGLFHQIRKVNISHLGSGDMADSSKSSFSVNSEFWPFRNQFLITIGAKVALQHNCDRILIGTVITDRRHQDGTEVFILTMNKLLALQEGNLKLLAPGAQLTSFELVEKSKVTLGVLGWCHSCHKANFACGRCRGCIKHSEIMTAFGLAR
jgi:7-cyano-7-deazaguanine synthase